jgi:DNA-binding PadR family transcriptional regulator
MHPFFKFRGSSTGGPSSQSGRDGRGGRGGRFGGGMPPEGGPSISGMGFFGGGGGGGGRSGGGSRGGRRERVFEPGDMKLLALHILAQQPSHGYELIRAIGEVVGGDYNPSPGTVYPTLNLLEDMGWIRATEQEGGRKQHSLTPEGQAQLAEQNVAIQQLLARLGQLKTQSQARRIPEVQRAMENLKTALQLRFEEGSPDAAQVQRVADIIDRAAADIGRL